MSIETIRRDLDSLEKFWREEAEAGTCCELLMIPATQLARIRRDRLLLAVAEAAIAVSDEREETPLLTVDAYRFLKSKNLDALEMAVLALEAAP